MVDEGREQARRTYDVAGREYYQATWDGPEQNVHGRTRRRRGCCAKREVGQSATFKEAPESLIQRVGDNHIVSWIARHRFPKAVLNESEPWDDFDEWLAPPIWSKQPFTTSGGKDSDGEHK
jgi:hypothetical protein